MTETFVFKKKSEKHFWQGVDVRAENLKEAINEYKKDREFSPSTHNVYMKGKLQKVS